MMQNKKRILFHIIQYCIQFILFLDFIINAAYAQSDIFNPTPDFIFDANSFYSTGLGIADIDGDGWEDIIVANGNDIEPQNVCVYYNNGDGTYPASPSWTSGDIDYNCHVAVGDINGDNLPDVAVSVFMRRSGLFQQYDKGYIKVYFNQGSELESMPTYQSEDSMCTFSCALGDADGDGDLDLAVADSGPSYCPGIPNYFETGRIYFNESGHIQPLPGWKSENEMMSMDVEFADMDNNGYLDIVFANQNVPHCIFLADSCGLISNIPAWTSQMNLFLGNSLYITRIDSNDFPDLVFSGQNWEGPERAYEAYLFDSYSSKSHFPNWYVQIPPNLVGGTMGSALWIEDINHDGHVDLLGGCWYGCIRLYMGSRDIFGSVPYWISDTYSVHEAFVLRDLDHDNRFAVMDTITLENDNIHVVTLQHPEVEQIVSVRLNGQALTFNYDYCTVPGAQWISTKQLLHINDEIVIEYLISHDRDLVVSNWDTDVGNYIFYNQTNPTTSVEHDEDKCKFNVSVYPNPFNQECRIQIYSPVKSETVLNIFDCLGRLVRRIEHIIPFAGTSEIIWNGKNSDSMSVSSGIYVYQLHLENRIFTGKLMLLQ